MTARVALPIVAVTVHPDGATVTREGEVPGGEVALVGLPWVIDRASLRVAGDAAEVALEPDPTGLARGPAPGGLEALREAEAATARARAEVDALAAERGVLARLRPRGGDEPDRRLPDPGRLAAWAELDDRLEERLADLDARLAAARLAAAREAEGLALAKARLASDGPGELVRHFVPTWLARVRLPEGARRLALSYTVPGAAWSPAYALDADSGLARGRFALRALVVQATGEDWREVRLALSTTPVARAVALPTLPALRLSARQASPRPAWRELPAGLDALYPDGADPAPAAPAEEEPSEADEPAPEAAAAEDLPEAVGRRYLVERLERPRSRPMDVPVSAAAPARPRASAVNAPPSPALASRPSPSGGGAPGRPPPAKRAPAPEELQVADVDYGALRLAPASAGPGRRGRLVRARPEEVLAELGAGPEARAAVGRRSEALWSAVGGVAAYAWPPGHVLAGPIGGDDRTFAVDGAVDVPADGRAHSVGVTAWDAALAVTRRAVPRHDPRVFRTLEATAVDPDGRPARGALPPGPVDVRVGGRLEQTTHWEGSAGRGALRIGLGPDDRLTLARNVRYREEKAGLLGMSRRLHTEVTVDLASALPVAASVELLERLPVPAPGQSLTVDLTAQSPVAEVWKGEPDGPILSGGRAQRVEVPPGGQARAVLAYAVVVGAREELVGGDRRG